MSCGFQKLALSFCVLLATAHVGAVAAPTAPTDLAEVLPEGTLIYIGRSGSDQTETALKDTALGEMLADAKVKRFTTHVRHVIDQVLLQEFGDSKSDVAGCNAGMELLAILARRPSALAVLDCGIGEEGPFLQAALLCHLGKAEKDFLRHLDVYLEWTKTTGHDSITISGKQMKRLDLMLPIPIYYGVIEKHFILAAGEGTVEQLVEGLQKPARSLEIGRAHV